MNEWGLKERFIAVTDFLYEEFKQFEEIDCANKQFVDFSKFELLNNYKNISIAAAYNYKNISSFILNVDSEIVTFTGRVPIRQEISEPYFCSVIQCKKKYKRIIIRPETIIDKIAEIFKPIEVDFDTHKVFSKNYYVITNDETKEAILDDKILDCLQYTEGLFIEFIDEYILIRNYNIISASNVRAIIEPSIKLSECV